jgi:kynurenine formamidase
MTTLAELLEHITDGSIELVDLTAPLTEGTHVIRLPDDLGQAWPFRRTQISRYDAAGPDAYWNNISLSEHTGTHLDAPVHWSSGKHLEDVSSVPLTRLVGPAAMLDFSKQANADPDFLLERYHVEKWQDEHGALPSGGWLLYRTGWDARSGDSEAFLNGGHTPGVSVDCARWLAQETSIVGIGVETVGTDAGQAGTFDVQPWPCHWYFLGEGKYGITQLRNLDQLPSQGSVIIVAPLPIVDGSGSPARVIALKHGDSNSYLNTQEISWLKQRF